MATCVARRRDAASDVQLPYGEDVDGRLRHISEVPSGLACACKCPACGAALVARKGALREKHFAHHSSAACAKALESALHKLAKQVIADHRKVGLPAVEAVVGDERRLVRPAQMFEDIDVTLEEGMDGLRPDIVARKADRELLVEVAVTHFCDHRKIGLIRDRGLATVEIDLRGIRLDLPVAEIEEAILVFAPRCWIFNRRLEDAENELIIEREERAMAELARKERAVRAAAERALRVWRAVPPVADVQAVAAAVADKVAEVRDAGIGAMTNQASGGDAGFMVSRKVWQSVVVHHVIHPRWHEPPVVTKEILGLLKEAGLIKEGLAGFISYEVAETARLTTPAFQSPYEAVENYLIKLDLEGVLRNRGDYWIADGTVVSKCRNAIRAAKERRARVVAVRQAFAGVHLAVHKVAGDGSGLNVGVDYWMSVRHAGLENTPEALAARGQWQTDQLVAHLSRLREMVLGLGGIEENLLGLPLEGMREQRRQAIAEEHRRQEEERRLAAAAEKVRVEQERLEAAERSRRWAQEQRDLLLSEATTMLGIEDGHRFVHTPFDCLGGQSLAEVGAVQLGEDGPIRAAMVAELRHLSAIWERERLAADCQSQLRKAAEAALGEERAALWLKAGHPGLFRKRPKEVAVDEDGLRRCLILLRPQTVRRR